jgi:hypothetical protein
MIQINEKIEQMKEASELAPELLTKIAEMRGQLLLDLNYAQKCLRNKDHPWCSMLVSSSTDFTMKLSMGKVFISGSLSYLQARGF